MSGDPTREAIIKWLETMRTSSEVDPQDNAMAAKALGFIRVLELIIEQRRPLDR